MDETIKMICFGDTLLEDNFLSKTSADIFDVFNENDLVTFNLETVISDLKGNQRDKAFTFKTPPKNLSKFLLKTNTEIICNIANNHIMDYGEVCLNDTVKNLQAQKVNFTGYSKSLDIEDGITFIRKKSKKFAFIGAYNEYCVTEQKPGLTAINEALIKKVEFAKDRTDFVIIHLHWGQELSLSHTPKQKKIAKALVDAGADLIIGNHPHVIQSSEFYNKSFIAYSLGNFQIMTYNYNRNTSFGQMLQVEFNDEITVKILPVLIKNRCPEIISEKDQKSFKEYENIVKISHFYGRNNSWPLFFLHSSKFFLIDSYRAWRKRFLQKEENIIGKIFRWHFNKKTITMLIFGLVGFLFIRPLHWFILKRN